jgi:hypothetical protein
MWKLVFYTINIGLLTRYVVVLLLYRYRDSKANPPKYFRPRRLNHGEYPFPCTRSRAHVTL